MFEFDLVKKEEEIKPDFGPVGSIVDIRTYRRWLPNKKRRETFVERNTRVVEANLDLVKDVITPQEYNLERSIMLDHMNKLLALPSGRSMWIAGTEANKKHPASSFNCSALAINRVEAFITVFELLMLGTGVGFRTFSTDINQLPTINKFDIEFEDYKPKAKQDRLEDTVVTFIYTDKFIKYVEVGDSRSGWLDALRALLNHAFNKQLNKTIVFNFNSVRSLGERINGFGGTASGHEALKTLLKDVFDIFNECPSDKLRSIDCLDMCCAIAKGVVAGNTRRSALLNLYEEGDELIANAKVNLFDDPKLKNKFYRIQSNNTEALGTPYLSYLRAYLEANPDATKEAIWQFIDQYKPSVKWIKERFKVVANAGDPGFANYLKMVGKKWLAVRKYRPDVAVKDIWQWFCDLCSNPCFSGDTLIYTREGNYPIKDLVGKVVDVWDGTQWVTIDNFRVTGYNQEVFNIELYSGDIISATANHTFILNNGTKKLLKDLKVGTKNSIGDILLSKEEPTLDQVPYMYGVKSITSVGVQDKVYCCTVPTNNQITLANGIVTGQCFEIVLSVGYKDGKGVSFCNLTTLPINKFVIKRCNNNDLCAVTGYKLDDIKLEQAIRLTVRTALRQTCVTMPRPELDITQKAERLLGVSITGWLQLFTKLDLSYAEQEELMTKLNGWANDEADTYSIRLGVERPLFVCCVKPEGSQAKVLGSSSGVHWDWAPYYINRIQMGANDALAKTLKEQGFSWIPTPYDLGKVYPTVDIWKAIELFRQTAKEDKELIFNSSNAVLFEFPINSGMVESQGSVSASRQLQNVLRFSDKYVDHMVSSTITAKEDEWNSLAEELHAEKNWSRFTNAAFLSYYSGNHPLLPNEEITEDVYTEMMSSFKDSEWVKDGKFYVNEDLLATLEQKALAANIDIDDVDLGAACSTGACPQR